MYMYARYAHATTRTACVNHLFVCQPSHSWRTSHNWHYVNYAQMWIIIQDLPPFALSICITTAQSPLPTHRYIRLRIRNPSRSKAAAKCEHYIPAYMHTYARVYPRHHGGYIHVIIVGHHR